MKRKQHRNVLSLTDRARLAIGSADIVTKALVTGNASGIHGGKKPKYGKRDRQASRLEQRRQELQMESEN